VIADGMIYVCGAKGNPFLAFHQCGSGDITSNGLAWSSKEYSTDCVTPLFYQDKLLMLNGDRQLMVCFDPTSGEVKWKQPLGVSDIFRASPTGADGKIYCFSERGRPERRRIEPFHHRGGARLSVCAHAEPSLLHRQT
jgi:outer membrane protein assembly factor BamB